MFSASAFKMQEPEGHDEAAGKLPSVPVDDDNLTRVVSADEQLTRVVPARRLSRPNSDAEATRLAPRAEQRTVVSHVGHPVARAGSSAANTLTRMATLGGRTLPGTSASTEMDTKQVGRYLILEKLGRGGMASVFRAHDPDIGRDVAIKFLHSTLCEDEEYRGRFLREARAAGGLSHPNIVTVHDVGEIDGRPYLAMELLQGKPLSEPMDAGKMLPIRDVVIIGMQLARALDYAHSRGVVHRDIKPGNIALLDGSTTIKVMDFGIAHMDMGGVAEQHTRVGDVLGTPQYMSPEQTRGEKLDGRSDLFSVGIMLYQMLAGQRPFQGGSIVAVAMKIAQETPVSLDKLRPEIPAPLRRIVERCLTKAPDQRFQNGKELSDALGRVLGQMDEADREREAPRIIPLRVKWAATMALIVAIVMGLVATVVTQRQYAAMFEQVSDNGAALARFLAAQDAEDALAERWESIDSRVQTMMKTGDFKNIVVVDNAGVVRASGRSEEVDHPYRAPTVKNREERPNGIVLTQLTVDNEPVLGFEAPIVFQSSLQGRVILGLRERPMVRVAQLSVSLMGVLVVVTVLAVAVAMYFVANWFSRPIKTIEEAMVEVAAGHLDHRIAEKRNDEFGMLFNAFDRMAQALQQARSGVPITAIAKAPSAIAGSTSRAEVATRPDQPAPPIAP